MQSICTRCLREEVSFRAKSIEGVGTTTTGFVGPRYGPVGGEPELLTSFADLIAFMAADSLSLNSRHEHSRH